MTRRRVLFGLVGSAGAAGAYPTVVEPRWLEVTHRVVRMTQSLPARVRILHLSDFHASPAVPFSTIERSIALGLDEAPDIACLTGDFISARRQVDFSQYAQVLRRLSSRIPTFAVLGNHDGGIWAAKGRGDGDHSAIDSMLRGARVEVLHNRSVTAGALSLVGVGDLWSREVDPARAFASLDSQGPTVLLAHNPDTKDRLRAHRWDLMLSGHTHGGQVRIPFDGDRFAPVADRRYVAGLKAWGARQIHVTCGVGNLHGVRFACRPEVSLLDLV